MTGKNTILRDDSDDFPSFDCLEARCTVGTIVAVTSETYPIYSDEGDIGEERYKALKSVRD